MAKYTAREIKGVLLLAGAAEPRAETLAAIAMAESGGETQAHALTTREDSWGWFQINRFAWPDYSVSCLTTPLCSAKAALAIAATERGYRHWSVYNSGRYLTFLPVGTAVPAEVGGPIVPADPQEAPEEAGSGGLFSLPPLPGPDELKKAGFALAAIVVLGMLIYVSLQGLVAATGARAIRAAGGGAA